MPFLDRHSARARITTLLVMAVFQSCNLASADQIKQNNLLPLNDIGSWSSAVPGSSDVVIFDNTLTGTGGYSLPTGANGTWAGIRLVNPASFILISDNTLTLGASGIDMSAATQTLTLNTNISLANPQTWNSATSLIASGSINLGANNILIRGTGSVSLAGVVSGAGGSITKTDSGVLNLTGTNSYNGGFTQLAGVTTFASSSAAGGTTSPINLSGGTLILSAPGGSALPIQNPWSVSGSPSLILNSSAAIAKNFTGNAAVSISVLAGNTFDLFIGVSVPSFSGFTGTLDFGTSSGAVRVASASAISATDLNFSSVSLNLGSASLAFLTNRASTQSIGALFGGPNTILGSASTGSTTYNIGSLATSTFAGSILNGTSGGNIGITKLGSSTLTLTGTGSNYTGILSIQSGVLSVSSLAGLGAATASTVASNLLISSSSTPAMLQYTGTGGSTAHLFIIASSAIIDSSGSGPLMFSGTGALAFGGIASNRTLTLTGANTNLNTFTPQIKDNLGAPTALIKTGAGTWVLSGTSNTYTGTTTISQGTLLVSAISGTPTGTGNITVSSGATYGGTGNNANIGSLTFSSTAHLSPGSPVTSAGVGLLNVNALNMNANSVLDLDFLNGTTSINDTINLLNSSTLTLSAPVNVNLYQAGTNLSFATAGSYSIFTGVTNLAGNPATDLHVLNAAGGASYAFSQIGSSIYLTVTGGSGPPPGWLGANSSDWSDSINWSGGIPSSTGSTAIFGPAATSFAVHLNGPRTMGTIALDAGTHSGYTIANGSGGPLTLDNGTNNTLINVTSGSHTISADVQLNSNTSLNFSNSSALTLSGLLTSPGTPTLTVNGTGTLFLSGNINFPGTLSASAVLHFTGSTNQNFQKITGSGAIQIDAGINLTSGQLTAASLLVGGTYTLRAQSTISGTSVLSSLTIAGNPVSAGGWTGKLDLTNNALVLLNPNTTSKFAAIAALTDEASSGKNGGSWNGTGITSSSIATNTNTTLAIVDVAELGITSFRGQIINANSLIVTQALLGDTDLSGKVDFTDLLKIVQDFGQPGGWAAGNVEGSATIGFADLLVAAQHFGQAYPVFPSEISINAVPEPDLTLLWVFGSIALALKRPLSKGKYSNANL